MATDVYIEEYAEGPGYADGCNSMPGTPIAFQTINTGASGVNSAQFNSRTALIIISCKTNAVKFIAGPGVTFAGANRLLQPQNYRAVPITPGSNWRLGAIDA